MAGKEIHRREYHAVAHQRRLLYEYPPKVLLQNFLCMLFENIYPNHLTTRIHIQLVQTQCENGTESTKIGTKNKDDCKTIGE